MYGDAAQHVAPATGVARLGFATGARIKFTSPPELANANLRDAWRAFVDSGWFPPLEAHVEEEIVQQALNLGFRAGVLYLHVESAAGLQVAVGEVEIRTLGCVTSSRRPRDSSLMRVVCYSLEHRDAYWLNCDVARGAEPHDEGAQFTRCANVECFPCAQGVELGRSLVYEGYMETCSSYLIPMGLRFGDEAGLASDLVEILGIKLACTGESRDGIFDLVKPDAFVIIPATRVRGCAWGIPLAASDNGQVKYGVLARFQHTLY
jgi:hypothetical protein